MLTTPPTHTPSQGDYTLEPSYNFTKQSPAVAATKKFGKKDTVKLTYDVKSEAAACEWAHKPFKVSPWSYFGLLFLVWGGGGEGGMLPRPSAVVLLMAPVHVPVCVTLCTCRVRADLLTLSPTAGHPVLQGVHQGLRGQAHPGGRVRERVRVLNCSFALLVVRLACHAAVRVAVFRPHPLNQPAGLNGHLD